jgi:hypothetical protein
VNLLLFYIYLANCYVFTGNFQRAFVCPAQSRQTFVSCRRFVAVDGTFLTGRFVQVLLAVGIDANGHNVILAWAVVESENEASWGYFLRLLRRSIPEISSERCVLISDRDKGLIEADKVLGDQVQRAFCCRHLKENFIDKFGRGLEPLFWRVVRARTKPSCEHWLSKIGEIKSTAEGYLRSIVSHLFITKSSANYSL